MKTLRLQLLALLGVLAILVGTLLPATAMPCADGAAMSCDVCLDGVLSGAPVCAAAGQGGDGLQSRQPAGTAGIARLVRRSVGSSLWRRPSAGVSAAALTAPLHHTKRSNNGDHHETIGTGSSAVAARIRRSGPGRPGLLRRRSVLRWRAMLRLAA